MLLLEEKEAEEDYRIAKKKKKKKKRKSKKKDSCGDVIVPEDVIICEVLARTPVKSLFRFKSVCKRWNHIISRCPFFSACHVQKGPNYATNFTGSGFLTLTQNFKLIELVVFSTDALKHQFKLPAPSFADDDVRGSTCGLIYGRSDRQIFIFNPITYPFTKHVTYIPNPNWRRAINLAYDPHNNPNFGFAIIALVKDDTDFGFDVYSSKTREWQISNAKVKISTCRHLREYCRPVFSRGKMYWSVVHNILWFDIEEDAAGFIQCPYNNNAIYPKFQDLGVCNGEEDEDISYTVFTRDGNIEIWLLRGDDEQERFEWERRFIVRLPEIVQPNWRFMETYLSRVVKPMQYMGGEVVWFIVTFEDYSEALYSINARTHEELKLIHNEDYLPKYSEMYSFIPSLLSCPT